MMSLRYVWFFLLAGASLTYANTPLPMPISSSYLGLDTLATSGYSAGSSCVDVAGVACGGEFTGTLDNGTGTPLPINFWCVDAQENFYFGLGGLAQVVPLVGPSAIASQPGNVTYSGVTNTGSPQWTFSTFNTGANGPGGTNATVDLSSEATTRYEMAAYLVSKFPGFDTSVDGSNAVSMAIEGAIWDIMSNTTPTVDAGFSDPEQGTTTSDIGYWVYQASQANNYTSTASDFAVISWIANPGPVYGLQSPEAQTFLVELDSPTPEPTFYGALAIGMSGLALAIRRRKKA